MNRTKNGITQIREKRGLADKRASNHYFIIRLNLKGLETTDEIHCNYQSSRYFKTQIDVNGNEQDRN